LFVPDPHERFLKNSFAIWECLSKAKPMSTVFVAGSAIAIYPKGPLLGS
jgi:hypothetical protein